MRIISQMREKCKLYNADNTFIYKEEITIYKKLTFYSDRVRFESLETDKKTGRTLRSPYDC